jgi:hypothetical protein
MDAVKSPASGGRRRYRPGMDIVRDHGWRIALVLSGILTLAGGSMHPDAATKGSVRVELAQMTADDRWVPGHALIAVGTALLALGLWSAYRRHAWPASVLGALLVAAVAFSLYTVETVMHMLASVDSDALRTGDTAPVAMSHLALAAVLYPVSGLALAYLSIRIWKAGRTAHRVIAVIGVVGGLVHAASVPLTLLFQNSDFTSLFPAAAMLTTLWAVTLGLVGFRSAAEPARQTA